MDPKIDHCVSAQAFLHGRGARMRPAVHRLRRAARLCSFLTAAATSGAWGQTASDSAALASLSLESLLELEVSGASKFNQPVRHAPSTITGVSAAEIRPLGFRSDVSPLLGYFDHRRLGRHVSLLAEDQIPLSPQWALTFGARYHHSSSEGGGLSPRWAAVWPPSEAWVFRYLYGAAHRPANALAVPPGPTAGPWQKWRAAFSIYKLLDRRGRDPSVNLATPGAISRDGLGERLEFDVRC